MSREWIILGALLICEALQTWCYNEFTFHQRLPSESETETIHLHGLYNKKMLRTRRSLGKAIKSQPELPNNLNFEFEAFQQSFQMNLTLDRSFSHPYIIQKGNISWIDTPYISEDIKTNASSGFRAKKQCVYTGVINKDQYSVGVFNNCIDNHLEGSFIHGDHEYSIHSSIDKLDDAHILSRRKRSLEFRRKRSPDTHEKTISDHNGACATDTSDTRVRNLYSDYQASLPNSGEKSRRRRSVSREHTVELMFVADSKMAEYHGDGLEQYVLSLIAVASRIYKDASLGNNVNLALVKLQIITDEKDGPNITADAQDSLNNFCTWQYEENDHNDSHVYHHDAAVLLTRVDLCRSEGKCGTLGLAELGTVCNPNRSCAIIEDNGLSSAFTIAHEIGHVFGIPHDDSETCTEKQISGDFVHHRSYKENQYHLMSSTLDYNSQTWSWSQCSRKFITKFLDIEDNIQCLGDKPPSPLEYQMKLDSHIATEPGQAYDKNVQCEMVYGRGAKICPYMPVCRRLWCTLPDNAGCRTQHMPWADGTECGSGKWCERGMCRRKSLRPESVDGEWSAWDGWTQCSRTCGGGIKFSERKCDNPQPQFGGRYCTGRRIKYKACNTQRCPPGPSFRELQCAQYNGRTFNNEDFPANPKYIPHYSEVPSEQCKLYCSVEGMTPNYYKLQHRVEDGTKCMSDGTDVCVNGVCMGAGCDNELNSGLTWDMCGVCGGDNSTCQLSTVSKRAFTTGVMPYGYNQVVTLPINASSVLITQTSLDERRSDENYLAVAVRTAENTKKYLFNGRYIVMKYGLEVKLTNGATIEFSGSEQVTEKIAIRGYISEELYIEVLSVGTLHPANIEYSYVLPVKGAVSFDWAINDTWTECSKECRGERTKQLSCVREQDNLHVNDKHCADKRQPNVKKEYCNLQCDIRWQIESIEDCSANCGRGFVRRKVTCIKQSSEGIQKLDDNECTTPKPSNIEACQGKCSPTQWRFSEWSNCSKSCGGGTQTREAKCALRNGRYVSDFACNRLEKLVSRSCNSHACTSYEVSEWNKCSVSCGFGTQSRSVVCLEGGAVVDLSRCGSRSPESVRTCNAGVCAGWKAYEWTDCTVTCGTGIRYREVQCMRGNEKLDDEYCPLESQPAETANCTMPIQCPDWIYSNWTSCSQTCGREGVKRRNVECKDHQLEIVPTFSCDLDKKPAETMECPQKACTENLFRGFGIFGLQNQKVYRWRYGGWASCSVSCGPGVKQRYVSCSLDSDPDKKFDDSYCWKEPKPEVELACRRPACGSWRTGTWSHCSGSCGEGVQVRVVVCALDDGTYGTDEDCDSINKPENEKPCEILCPPESSPAVVVDDRVVTSASTQEKIIEEEMITTNVIKQDVEGKYWRTGAWSECSKSCAGGQRRRAVECFSGYSQGSGCDINEIPTDQEDCNTDPCPTWRKGGWTKCSHECGFGMQQRMVVCQLHDGSIGTAGLCGGSTPESVRDCVVQPCGVPLWNTTTWSQCSASCGAGEVIRNVTCVDSANTSLVLDSDQCAPEARPNHMETCIQSTCTQWQLGDWQQCSGTCESSSKSRDVSCVGLDGGKLDDSRCDIRSKPAASEPCELEMCQFNWQTYEWSQCSTSCGEGIRIRSMKCIAINGSEVMNSHCAKRPSPNRMEACNKGECPVWKESEWDQCSVTCGYGQKLRLVQCFNLTSQRQIIDKHCDLKSKPTELIACQTDSCPIWVTSEWNKCSGPCNASESVQTRQVQCVTTESTVLADSACDKSSKPDSSRRCQDCAFWTAEDWSRCSMTCGRGIQVRKLTCVGSDGLKRSFEDCSKEVRPKIIQTCNNQPCASWSSSAWGQCSVSCGEGFRSRLVECVDDINQQTISDNYCDVSLRPSDKLSCTLRTSCPIWATSLWGPCSATCGEGLQKRDLICMDSQTSVPLIESQCVKSPKPTASIICERSQCGKWKATQWSECSVSCGDGKRNRNVTCSLPAGTSVPDSQCSLITKPTAEEACSSPKCQSGFQWKSEKWSQCSTACGYGIKTRRLKCISEKSRKQVPIYACTSKTKPKEQRRCQQKHCPTTWWTDQWSKCSASCGEGRQFRKVLCKSVSAEGWYLGNSIYGCKMEDKPDAIRTCSLGPCEDSYVWQTGSWGKCDAVCGQGKERRKVRCVTMGGKKVSRSNCDIRYKPDRAQDCYAGPCESESCSELRTLSSVREDGEYQLLINNKLVSVYCHRMSSKEPREYITLAAGPDQNYATIYGQRLAQPYSCPYIDNRADLLSPRCTNCVSNIYQKAGETRFSKIRFQVENMTVDITDFQFARTSGRNYIGYGSAGDCYSAKNCPQGRFSINLRNTGFRVSSQTQWKTMGGPYAFQNVERKKNGDVVKGRCGGYCGLCTPSDHTGLKLEVIGNT